MTDAKKLKVHQMAPYGIADYGHAFAAWAACRAASTAKGYRFSVQDGRATLEAAGLNAMLAKDGLPVPADLDVWHREKRLAIINTASDRSLTFSHGIAAKLINVYLKARFVVGDHSDAKVGALHPPIDRELLKGMDTACFGARTTWVKLGAPGGWSKLDSDAYQALIDAMRAHLDGRPFWTIEQYWPGYQ